MFKDKKKDSQRPIAVPTLRRPNDTLMPRLLDTVSNDLDAYTPDLVKLEQRGVYTILDMETMERVDIPSFNAVLLTTKEALVRAHDAAPDAPMIEKTICTILRCGNGLPKGDERRVVGRLYPETLWVSKSGTAMLEALPENVVAGCILEFGVEHKRSVQGDVRWFIPKIESTRPLEDEDRLYVAALRKALVERDAAVTARFTDKGQHTLLSD